MVIEATATTTVIDSAGYVSHTFYNAHDDDINIDARTLADDSTYPGERVHYAVHIATQPSADDSTIYNVDVRIVANNFRNDA